ncbi:stage VI sporulation protein D [Bacillus sp. AFS015802]|uniref:stage VI sporulation protein D n=1 Tax=Bacillus sp. AFS015802 TaxID=2033486 RepID=UPI000BF88F59|nr:stage VI sporulation protein D [Bacillus sp. AFS015802]PFA64579.1 stage VI sporulation protein D [Bacillus sp. AFS015802]
MSQEQQSCLRFSLEESIWFKKGQEVEELLSISLDPHITIQEQEQYVLIRGSLDLSGEYLPTSPREEEEDEFEASGKFVQTVEKRERGEYEFVHRFPVDVTIPKNRIANLGDIDVYVESFDYVVPENACLKLNADLTITGIYGEQQAHTPLEAEYEREQEFEPLYRSSAALELEEEVETEEEEEREEVYGYDQDEEDDLTAYVEEDDAEEDYSDDEYQPFHLEGRTPPGEQEDEIPVQIQYDANPALSYQEADYRKENVFELPQHELSESSEEQHAEPKAAYTPPPAPKYKAHEMEEEESSSSSSAVEAEMEESGEEKEEKKKTKGKKKYESISLTDFFARKEEEKGATLRVCIVQEGENLDYIAEKYDLTIPQLLRVNQLEANQDVYAGQVLYIPNSEFVFKG